MIIVYVQVYVNLSNYQEDSLRSLSLIALYRVSYIGLLTNWGTGGVGLTTRN